MYKYVFQSSLTAELQYSYWSSSSSVSKSVSSGDDCSDGSSCHRSTVFILSCLPKNGQI